MKEFEMNLEEAEELEEIESAGWFIVTWYIAICGWQFSQESSRPAIDATNCGSTMTS